MLASAILPRNSMATAERFPSQVSEEAPSDGGASPYKEILGLKKDPENHYELLSIDLFEDDADIIARKHDMQMTHLRTFQNGKHADESQKLLNEIAAAQECLLNEEKKAAYDETLRRNKRAKPPIRSAPLRQPDTLRVATEQPQQTQASVLDSRRSKTRKNTNWVLVGGIGAGGAAVLGGVTWLATGSGDKSEKTEEDKSVKEIAYTEEELKEEGLTAELPHAQKKTPVVVEPQENEPVPVKPEPVKPVPFTPPEFKPVQVAQVETTTPVVHVNVSKNTQKPAVTPEKPEDSRLAVPPKGKDRTEAYKTLKDTYPTLYEKKDWAQLSSKLLEYAQGLIEDARRKRTKPDPNLLYATLDVAQKAAALAGKADQTLQALDARVKAFKVPGDPNELELDALGKVKPKTVWDKKKLADEYLDVADTAIDEGNPEAAKKAAEEVQTLWEDLGSTFQRKNLRRKVGIQQAAEALKDLKDPNRSNDAAAHTQLGDYYHGKGGDFINRALYAYAQGEGFKSDIARGEIAKPTKPGDQIALGDLWSSKDAQKHFGDLAKQRAGKWYTDAYNNDKASFAEKKKAEVRGKNIGVNVAAGVVAVKRGNPKVVDNGGRKKPKEVRPEISKSILAKLFRKIQTAKNSRRIEATEVIGASGGKKFVEIPTGAAILIGFNASRDNGRRIATLQAIYLTQDGEKNGTYYGHNAKRDIGKEQIKAKEGYAVGGLRANAGDSVHGFSLIFHKIEGTGLNPEDTYESDFFGFKDGKESIIEVKDAIIGIRGNHGSAIDSLGFIKSR